ncbi:translation factor sui1, putative [Entamoeba invadens IP1]|uniref:Translation factor sui1, putative n=1 Tax=Entamoeba invadens IP1 TaxID=370355 RepID=L7FKB3_ENTIV|nr:translation factor sui1, putative [Entamoeba invadens IP1]ELP86364.1 translation factor sui1, putative [Entamoeba invadens IP1]|eukprot:XP_004185710.1 translation factor sui1, putative [Entamoeba invadens IP1]
MSEKQETLITNTDQLVEDSTISGKGAFVVHFRIQQRGKRKCLTTISGLPERYDMELILKHFKHTFSCNGSLEKKETGTEMKLTGDQRKAASNFFITEGILTQENIKIHGF